jgi:outer membrane receptor protein involved in Fe transport
MTSGEARPAAFLISGLVAAITVLLTPLVGSAQDDDEQYVEEIVVTGSRIARRDFTAPSPITTVDRSTIENSGQPTLEEALNQMPQVIPDFGRTSNNPGNGTSRINLRGLGSQRTLVMLNGRRLAPSGVGSSVDLNNLPQVLIDRVEIITGGATTVYGSDAVAGVVNFILRDDFDGIGLDASAYVTEAGDSEVYDVNATWGHNFANGRGNITLYASYLDRGESFAADRAFTSIPWRTDDFGNIFPGGSSAIPEGRIAFPQTDLGDGNPVQIKFTPDGIPVEYVFPDDLYNFAPVNYLQIPMQRYSGGLFLNYDVTDGMTAYTEITHTRNEVGRSLAPVPLFAFLSTNLDNPVLTPEAQAAFQQYVPTGPNTVGFFMTRRMEEFGFRTIDSTNDYSRIVAGLRGDIAAGWDFDIWATYTKGEEDTLEGNDGSFARLQQGLLVDPVSGACLDPSNGCVALDLFGQGRLTPEMLAFLMSPPYLSVTSRTQKLISGYVRGEVFRTWAGPIAVAFGAEWRSDDGSFRADDALFTGDSIGYAGDASVIGEESVTEVYAEALIPLAEDVPFARRLSLEVGGRYSEYDKAGSADTWKFGGEWEPIDDLRFRAMWQRSVRAPDLFEAFQEEFITFNGYIGEDSSDDPCSASADPVGRGNVEKCVLQGIPVDQIGIYEATPFFPSDELNGGNPNLQPEKAETRTVGVVFTGLDDWTFTIDVYDLEVDNTIMDAVPDVVCFNQQNTTGALCDKIVRDADAGYNVVRQDLRKINVGIMRTSGVDTQVSYAAGLPRWLTIGDYADLSIDLIWTHMLSNDVQLHKSIDPSECAGFFGFPCSGTLNFAINTFPENRVTTNIAYVAGNLDLNLTWRWIEGTDNAWPIFTEFTGQPDPTLAVPSIGSKGFVDLGGGYAFNDNVSVRLNVSNLFDTDPAFMADQGNQNNTDGGMYDLFGRSYQLSFSLRY